MAATKVIKVLTLTSDTQFENFASLTLIDADATDGFQLAGADGVYGQVPTAIVINMGPVDLKPISKAMVKATSGKSLNVTAILIQ